jgi:putative transposase
MPNHIYLIIIPPTKEGLGQAIDEAHRRYTLWINFREKWKDHLWQERYTSFPMDEQYMLATARYIERNPVATMIVVDPEEYRMAQFFKS